VPKGFKKWALLPFPVTMRAAPTGTIVVGSSAILPAQSTMVTEMPEGLYQDWHPASRRQLLVVLSGTLEVETSDGKKRRCSSGDVFLADDVGSRGHRTRTIGGPARVLFVHLPPEANFGT
jgi:redox-sensitive bicupin YhaK (pirin superfamily)